MARSLWLNFLIIVVAEILAIALPTWVKAQILEPQTIENRIAAEGLTAIEIDRRDWEQTFGGQWEISKAFRAAYVSWKEGDSGANNRTFSDDYELDEFYFLETEFSSSVKTGSLTQETSIGLELSKNPFNLSGQSTHILGNVLNSRQLPSPFSPTDFVSPNNSLGLFLGYELTLGDRLSLSFDGEIDLEITDTNPELPTFTLSESEPFIPEITISYQLARSLWLYGTYSQSSETASGSNFNGEPLQPQSERSLEVGIEAELLDGKMSASLSASQTTQKHVTTTDPDRPDFQMQVDEEQTRSLTWQVIGEILPGWDLNAYYAYADGRITQDSRFPIGNQIENAAQHYAGIWTTYEIQHGSGRGLGLGGGLSFVGDRPGDRDNTYKLPSYLQTDLVFFYHGQNCQVAINFQNLFNADNIDDRPLTVLGTLLIEF
ncbi:MAG: TonB-dependent receptor [Cyanosarcina radialis HA8281-LM2]|nr:TonB-dependent receptor [Cyanosarcina radialis HA8281-LM2]